MIKYVKGDILLAGADAIAHGVAPNDDFKNGLALTLREQWPSMYKEFRHFCKATHPKEGGVWSWKGAEGPIIVHLLTQEHPSTHDSRPGKATLTYVGHALKNLAKEVNNKGLRSVSITKLATGVGGLRWEDVKPLIEKYLGDLDIPVYVYEKYTKNLKAEEMH